MTSDPRTEQSVLKSFMDVRPGPKQEVRRDETRRVYSVGGQSMFACPVLFLQAGLYGWRLPRDNLLI